MINKNFTLLWWGQFVSQVGNRLYLMALSWHFVAEIGDSKGLFILFIISSLPSLLFGALVGPLIDRCGKKKILIGCDTFCGLLTGLLAFLVYNGTATPPVIYAICFLINSINLLFSPAVNSMMPLIIENSQLQRGMSYMKMITFLGQILGAAIGGMLVGFLGVYLTILINSISFLLSAFSELFITFRESITRARGNYVDQIKEGIKYVTDNPLVKRVTIIAVGCNLFIPVIFVYIPLLIKNELGLGAMEYGFADAMIPAGSVLIALVIATQKKQILPLRVLTLGLGGLAVCCFSLSFFSNYAIILFALFLYGIFVNYININVITYFVKSIDAEFRGRFFSILESFSYASVSLSYALATVIQDFTNVTTALAINSFGLLAFVAVAAVWDNVFNKKTEIG